MRGMVFLFLVWAYFRLPEPKDRTYAEIDMLFEQGVSARNFSSTEVDPYVLADREKTRSSLHQLFWQVMSILLIMWD